ncbi:DUF1707 domain-containing protein [Corynebacterium sp. TAE3-ERU12]|uniref:DUF1707 SHOCT-like domain-containing protein n=1 Tax=Corynebacterium sp. TAE3-ERU12 TaxID=2849491 RepID=UPI001C46929E|nr:DUF1707 domain-containing protein [Corynebacterium sp. TAE3-ERU12]MBV7294583.1 DUF1707 domain-containing protein [Corynebacterium sp. TAE3-ERU12]
MATDDGKSRPLRASDDQRSIVLDELAQAYARGQLTMEEFEQRSAEVTASVTVSDLTDLLADVHADPDRLLSPGTAAYSDRVALRATPTFPVQSQAAASLPVTGENFGPTTTVAFFSGAERTASWNLPRKHTACTLFGGVDLDLTNVSLEAQETTVNVVAVMGGADIIVPDDVRIAMDGVGLFGGFDCSDQAGARPMCEVASDAPLIRFTGWAVLGGVDIVRRPARR